VPDIFGLGRSIRVDLIGVVARTAWLELQSEHFDDAGDVVNRSPSRQTTYHHPTSRREDRGCVGQGPREQLLGQNNCPVPSRGCCRARLAQPGAPKHKLGLLACGYPDGGQTSSGREAPCCS
jgi:hypothetical protein